MTVQLLDPATRATKAQLVAHANARLTESEEALQRTMDQVRRSDAHVESVRRTLNAEIDHVRQAGEDRLEALRQEFELHKRENEEYIAGMEHQMDLMNELLREAEQSLANERARVNVVLDMSRVVMKEREEY